MRVTLSAAVTADGYLDDTTPRRLMISTPGDWADACRLRTEHDAILVGAATLRRDNPALRLRDETVRAARLRAGLPADIAKATLTASGRLSPDLRFFTEGDAAKYVFAPHDIDALAGIAEVIPCEQKVTACRIVTELEKRGIRRLLVEGGAHVLRMFLDEGMADTVRLAVNPSLTLGAAGHARFAFRPPAGASCTHRTVDGMEVAICTLHPDTADSDRTLLRKAVAAGALCEPNATSYCVGAVVATADGRTFAGHTHETSATHHAEQEAVAKALAAGADPRGATIYSSMEPCSTRASEPESCTQLILRHGFARVVFAMYEPDRFVRCRGALTLREAGLDVRCYPELADGVRAANAHLWR